MHQYEVKFRVNGTRSETIVSANSSIEARRLVEAMYSGSKVTIIDVHTL